MPFFSCCQFVILKLDKLCVFSVQYNDSLEISEDQVQDVFFYKK